MRIATAVLIGAALLLGAGCHKAKPVAPAPAPAPGPAPAPAQRPGGAGNVGGVDMPQPANRGGGGGGFGGGGGGAVMAVRKAVDREKAANDLKQIGLFYAQYRDENNRAPASQQDFIAYIQRDAPKIVQALKDGWYLIYWNVRADALPAGTSGTVLAYEKEVPTSDGMVVMVDGTVKRMSAQEFAAAAKPQ